MDDFRLRLRLLHLSDLHFRADRESEPWRRQRVLGPAWEENLRALLEDGPIDLVAFTGDAADWGRREEFAEADAFLAALLDRLGLPRDRLFVVPGNHDIDRSVHPEAWQEMRRAAGEADPLAFARWMAGGNPPRGMDPAWRKQVLERQAAYRAWVRFGLGRPELDPAAGPHGRLGYRARLERRGVEIQVIGLDSAWLCGDDADSGRLRVSDEQVMRLLTDEQGRPLAGLRLVLMHHPLHDLADADRIRSALAEHADLVLRGHLHVTELSVWADPDRALRQLAAGCLYEGDRADRWPNACQVVTLDLERPRKVEVRLRRFSPQGGHWFDDDGLYRESRHGRVSWTVEPERAHVAGRAAGRTTPNPFDPWNPATPPRFQGRTAELRRLEATLGDGHGVSVVGDSRIGKSSLLRTLEARLQEGGAVVRWLDGQGPEGVSEAAFVTRVTGRTVAGGADAAADALAAWASAEPQGLAPVLLVDEFDGLPERFDLRFFERWRHLLGRVLLVCASRREVDELYAELGKTSPFDNRLRLLRLSLLEEAPAERLIELGSGILDAEDVRLLRHWAGRHPLYLQLLGHGLAEARNLGESRARALDRFRDEAGRRLRDLWRRLEARDQQILRDVGLGERRAGIRRLARRGLLDDEGRPFGEVLIDWLREEEP